MFDREGNGTMTGGGFKAITYSLKAASAVGFIKMFKAIFSRNTCKACAMGMGGQKRGMFDEQGNFPEVCKKAFQAQLTDIQSPVSEKLFREKSIEDFKKMPARLLARSGRLNFPLYKKEGDTHYSAISWDEAIEKTAQQFKSVQPERSFFYSSGRSSNEAAFLLQLFARMYGTNNVNNCSYFCHQATIEGMISTIGVGTATVQLKDIEQAELIFVIGANPASNHPRYLRQLVNCRRRGGVVIVINPAKEKGLVKFAVPSDLRSMAAGGSAIASEFMQINIGGDIALLKGIAKGVIEAGKHDLQFMGKHTNGSKEYLNDIQSTSWEAIVSHSGISKERIERIASIYGNSTNTIFSWAMGITHHEHGVENVESIVNLALVCGMNDARFTGLLPLRGQSNIQGIGSVGVTPVLKKKIYDSIEKNFGVSLPSVPGMDILSCMKAAFERKIDLAFLLGGNLYGASPDTQRAEKALNNIPFKIYLSTTLNHGHFYGADKEVLILPVAARDEEKQKTTQESMFNFVRMSDGGIERLQNVRSEVDIISCIAQKVLNDSPIDFGELKSHQNIRKFIAQTVPGYEKLGKIEETGEEHHIPGRIFHEPRFATSDQKANFRICPIPLFKKEDGDFRMMTVRSEGQFNSVIYDEEDIYREQTSRWIVMMNCADMKEKGLLENDPVTIESSAGKMEKVAVREFDVARGNIITYFPEANVLVPAVTDPRSRTPAYKSVRVKVKRAEG